MVRVDLQAHTADPRLPIGRTRLETAGVVGCAVIMTLSTIEVIQSAGWDLYKGYFKGTAASQPKPAECLLTPIKYIKMPSNSEVVTGG